jgi:hypothetical protein
MGALTSYVSLESITYGEYVDQSLDFKELSESALSSRRGYRLGFIISLDVNWADGFGACGLDRKDAWFRRGWILPALGDGESFKSILLP